ncbi:glycosyltransferase family 4 protein [Phenylobacterium sp.]|uniref:glycosyltransferase family 4 protein n=1 Tax=Phenylobacterium sp. TaxID=1871053 RepID=UPI0030F4177A
MAEPSTLGRRVVFVNRFYAPDMSATSQILTRLAEHLAGLGWQVSVVTSRQLYGAPGILPSNEEIAGVQVQRVLTTRFGNAGLAGRALDYLSFYLTAFLALLTTLKRGDIVVAKTDPPLISVFAHWAAALKGARLVNWLQDLYPEIAVAYGVRAARGPLGAILKSLRNTSLRGASVNVVICEDMARIVTPLAGTARVEVVHNWSDDTIVRPVAPEDNPLVAAWGLQDRFVVGYSGNLGRAHDWRTLVAAAAHLRDRPDILFLMIGGGAGQGPLRAEVERLGLQASFRFEPYQPHDMLACSLSLPHVHLVSLLPEFRGLMFPSKVFGIAAAGRGMIAIVDQPSDLADMVLAHGSGEATPVADGAALASVIVRMADEAGVATALGLKSLEMLEAGFACEQTLKRWGEVLETA